MRMRLHAYMAGVTKQIDCPAIEVGGVADHVHLLVRLNRTMTIADWMREIKRVSSSFIKESQSDFAWQGGYGAFSISHTDLNKIGNYIRCQEEHHRTLSFQEEFLQLLKEHDLEWDEKYIWD